MGQHDIYMLLKNKLLSGDQSFFSCREIQRMLNGKGLTINIDSINTSLVKLRTFGYLDMRIEGYKRKNRVTYPITVYRLKKEYLL
jgi:hypothetical protein